MHDNLMLIVKLRVLPHLRLENCQQEMQVLFKETFKHFQGYRKPYKLYVTYEQNDTDIATDFQFCL